MNKEKQNLRKIGFWTCFFYHKWSKWFRLTENRQERICSVCSKIDGDNIYEVYE